MNNPYEPLSNPFKPGRTTRLLPTLLVIVVAVAVAFVASQSPGEAPEFPPSPVDGVVVAVDSTGLGQVSGFALRVEGGFTFTFELGTLENATEFSPSHLAEHQATSVPVRVFYRVENEVALVYRLEDAPPPTTPPTTTPAT